MPPVFGTGVMETEEIEVIYSIHDVKGTYYGWDRKSPQHKTGTRLLPVHRGYPQRAAEFVDGGC